MRAIVWAVLGLVLGSGCRSGERIGPGDTPKAPSVDTAGDMTANASPDTTPNAVPDAAVAPDTVDDVDEPAFVEAWARVAPLPVPPIEPTTGACVHGAGLEVPLGYFVWPELSGRRLELCTYGAEAQPTCQALDLDTLAVTALKTPARLKTQGSTGTWALPPMPDVKVSKDGKRVEARVGEGPKAPFKRLDTGGMPIDRVVSNGKHYAAVASAWTHDMSALPDAKILVFSRQTGARVTEIPFDALESSCPLASFAGDLLYVEAGVCAGPGAVGLFIEPTTGKIVTKLGGLEQSAAAYGVAPVALDDGHLAFREQYGLGLFVHDRATGAVLRTLNLSATLPRTDDGTPWGDPEGGGLFALRKAKADPIEALVALQKDRVALIDPSSWTIKRLIGLTGCPPTE